jgi:hypothetical protein
MSCGRTSRRRFEPREPRDLAASVRQRLLNRAKERGDDFQLVLTWYGIERLLYRFSASPHADAFILKGAMLFSLWSGEAHRPTRDLDLLGFGDARVSRMEEVMREVCQVPCEDGLEFDPASVRGEEIRSPDEYDGVRIKPARNGQHANEGLCGRSPASSTSEASAWPRRLPQRSSDGAPRSRRRPRWR